MVATAALETSELQRGDGAWENIQDVLRSAFLALQRDSLRHAERLSVCEQRVMDLGDNCAGKVELQRFAQQTQHVDALARAVNALSDELRDLSQREDARHEQHKQWSASLPAAVALQLRDAETRVLQRVASVEEGLRSSLAKLERRLALVDQELGHLAVAVDSKADVESVQRSLQTQRKLTDDALKQRCRKAAFDREVLRVHQLLRTHQTTLVEQHEALQQQLRDDLERLRSESLSPSTLQSQLSALRAELVTRVEDATRQQQTATDDVRVLLQLETAQTRGACRDALAKAVDDLQQRNTKQMNETSEAIEELSQQLTTLRLETSDAVASARATAEAAATEAANAEANTSVDGRQTLLEAQLNERVTQTKHELEASLSDWTRTRERKLRQQLSAVAARLSEMDQVLKLAGQQLVQNTSQLQLLWSEWQRAPPSAFALNEDLLTDEQEEEEEEEEAEDEQQQREDKRKKNEGNAPPPSAAAALRDLVEAKLREYDKVLEPARDE